MPLILTPCPSALHPPLCEVSQETPSHLSRGLWPGCGRCPTCQVRQENPRPCLGGPTGSSGCCAEEPRVLSPSFLPPGVPPPIVTPYLSSPCKLMCAGNHIEAILLFDFSLCLSRVMAGRHLRGHRTRHKGVPHPTIGRPGCPEERPGPCWLPQGVDCWALLVPLPGGDSLPPALRWVLGSFQTGSLGGEQLSLVDSSRSTALCPFTRQAFITPRDNYFLQLSDKGTRAESLTESPQARSLCQRISSCTYQCAVATCPCFLVR